MRWRAGSPGGQARALGDADVAEALALCAADPVASVLAAVRLDIAARTSLAAAGGDLWGFPSVGPLTAVCWAGANVVPVNPSHDPAANRAFADRVQRRGREVSSVVGPAADVLELWKHLEQRWRPAREVRPEQPSMVLDGPPAVRADPAVRLAVPADFGAVLPACVAMFTEEVGYSPIAVAPQSYAERVRWLVEQRCSWVRTEQAEHGSRVVFKTELGACSAQVGQLQGVWVHPDRRGQGLSAPGVAAVAAAVLQRVPTVSLYVNSYNSRALATYHHVGFRQVGTYATVLF